MRCRKDTLISGFLVAAFIFVASCTGSRFTAPDAEYTTRTTETMRDGTVRVTETATKALGSSVNSDKAEGVDVGEVSATAEQASVGKGAYKGMEEHTSMTPLYVAGVAIIVGSVAIGWLVSIRLGLITGASGMVLLVLTRFIDMYPMFSMVSMGIVGISLLVYLAYTGRLGEDAKKTLSTVVEAIETSDEGPPIKSKIEETARTNGTDKTVKDTVNRTKKNMKL